MIHLIVALRSEAKPLIDHFNLKRNRKCTRLPVFEKDELTLTISGIGKRAAAAATDASRSGQGTKGIEAWLNIGVAGHAEYAVGRGLLAHRVTDIQSRHNWYPQIIFKPPCSTDDVCTVDNPNTTYRDPGVYDMEASGFYASAIRYSTAELVHCYKVISDNRKTPATHLSNKAVPGLIEKNLNTINHIIAQLQALETELNKLSSNPKGFDAYLDRWHFTFCQRNILHNLLQRVEVLAPNYDPWCEGLEDLTTSAEILRFLQARIDTLPVNYG